MSKTKRVILPAFLLGLTLSACGGDQGTGGAEGGLDSFAPIEAGVANDALCALTRRVGRMQWGIL